MSIVYDATEDSSIVAVPAVEWSSLLERFGRRHRAWLATIHGVEQGVPVTMVPSVPLESIVLERRNSDDVVRVMFANGLSLCALRPRAVRIQKTDEGAESALEIDTADDAFLRLAFRATALPDQLDGMAPGELHRDRP